MWLTFLSTGMHLWKLKYGAFIRDAQIYYCGRLIIVPLSTFHRLAELIGDPKGELTFLFHVPRSGSTLLIQVWLSTPIGCIMLNVVYFPLILCMLSLLIWQFFCALGTCESAVCVRIEYRIESGVTIRIQIESRIESAEIIYPLKPRPHWRP